MSTKQTGMKLAVAPAHVSAAINRLAALRAQMKAMAKAAKAQSAVIIKHGSCKNKAWAAYVYHSCGGYRESITNPATRVRVVPIKSEG